MGKDGQGKERILLREMRKRSGQRAIGKGLAQKGVQNEVQVGIANKERD